MEDGKGWKGEDKGEGKNKGICVEHLRASPVPPRVCLKISKANKMN